MEMTYLYAGATSLNDGMPYFVDWAETDFGFAAKRASVVKNTAGGIFTVAPIATAYQERRGRLAVYATATGFADKRRALSDLTSLLSGTTQLHLAGRYLEVEFLGAPEVDRAKRTDRAFGLTAEFRCSVPFWNLNQPLRGLVSPVNIGPEWERFDDDGDPDPLPASSFDEAEFVFDNWGNAFTYGAGTIVGGPVSTTVYLRGLGAARVAVTLDSAGVGAFAATDEIYLAAGENNSVRVEDAAGALVDLTSLPDFAIDFGETYVRFF